MALKICRQRSEHEPAPNSTACSHLKFNLKPVKPGYFNMHFEIFYSEYNERKYTQAKINH